MKRVFLFKAGEYYFNARKEAGETKQRAEIILCDSVTLCSCFGDYVQCNILRQEVKN